MAAPTPAKTPTRKPVLVIWLELWLFRARWLLAPFYVGLVLALAAVLVVFGGLAIARFFIH